MGAEAEKLETGTEAGPGRASLGPKGRFGKRSLFQATKTSGLFPSGFQICMRLLTYLFLPISPFHKWNVYPLLVLSLYLQTDNLFSVSQVHR